jgi:PKD repeat protein
MFAPDEDEPDTRTTIRFLDASSDPDGWIVARSWEFGDGEGSDEENPRHLYLHSGWYDVTLHVIDNDGLSDSYAMTIYVANTPPDPDCDWEGGGEAAELVADFTWSIVTEQHGSYPAGFSSEDATDLDDVQFENLSTGGGGLGVQFCSSSTDWDGEIVSWRWEFGDGSYSTEPAPTHTFPAPGTYRVRLTVIDDEGASASRVFEVVVGGSGGIDRYEWTINGPGQFVNGTTAGSEHPAYWFQDNTGEGPFEIALTVFDALGNSVSATKSLWVDNVPPTAGFTWSYDVPPDFLPSGEELYGGGEGGEGGECWGEGGYVIEEPAVPAQAGIVQFSDLSFDAESWFAIDEWLWDFDVSWNCSGEGEESCLEMPEPEMLFLDGEGGEGGDTLYRGNVQATLWVWDEDGAGGDGPATLTQTVPIDNIPPYAGFCWCYDEWNTWTELACGGGEGGWDSDSDGSFTVSRSVNNWDTGNNIFAPWHWWGEVELEFEGSGTVEVTETVPSGWEIGYWDEDLSLSPDSRTLSGTLDISEGGGYVYYELYPPYEPPPFGTAVEGTYQIEGTFINHDPGGEGDPQTNSVTLDSDVELCTTVDVDTEIELTAFGDEHSVYWFIDPNGDWVSYDWDLGEHGTETDQYIYPWLYFEGLTAFYDDEEFGEWRWEADVPIELTVTDEAGASTTVSETIRLSGPCEGGSPE